MMGEGVIKNVKLGKMCLRFYSRIKGRLTKKQIIKSIIQNVFTVSKMFTSKNLFP